MILTVIIMFALIDPFSYNNLAAALFVIGGYQVQN